METGETFASVSPGNGLYRSGLVERDRRLCVSGTSFLMKSWINSSVSASVRPVSLQIVRDSRGDGHEAPSAGCSLSAGDPANR